MACPGIFSASSSSLSSPLDHSNVQSTSQGIHSLSVKGLHQLLAMAGCSQQSRRIVTEMRRKLEELLVSSECPSRTGTQRMLECCACEGFMSRPVCLPCGHSVCQLCVERTSEQARDTVTCPKCKESHPRKPLGFDHQRKPTLLLQNVCQKWYPAMIECCRHREEGNKHARENDFALAAQCYDKAVETGVLDHRVFSNRSWVQHALDRNDAALRDADTCCCLRPLWPKGHYRRAVVLEKLGNYEEAAATFLLCLHHGGDQPVLKLLCKIVDRLVHERTTHPTSCSYTSESDLVDGIVSIAVEQLQHYQMVHHERGDDLAVADSLVDQADFECVLCTGLLFHPVTGPCGHSFCQSCLARSFDHTPFCPICRAPLGETFTQYTGSGGKMVVDSALEGLLLHFFPEAYQHKKMVIETEMRIRASVGISDSEDIPIFVCTMAFPGLPCPLHIFEPRYRLMMRRCIETNSRRFGMCLPVQQEDGMSFTEYGTVLFISSLEYTPDGRSLVTTMGECRFRVLQRGSTDGYNTARIQFIKDDPVVGDQEIASLRKLQEEVYRHANRWLDALTVFSRLLIMQNVCSPPPPIEPTPENCPNGPSWLWWFVSAVPTTNERKMEFLRSTSLRERLVMLRDILPLPTRQ